MHEGNSNANVKQLPSGPGAGMSLADILLTGALLRRWSAALDAL